MPNKGLKLFTGLFFVIYFNYNFAAPLAETIQSAILCNPEFLQSEDDRRIADSRLNQAYAGYLPQVNLTGAVGREKIKNAATIAVTGGSRTLNRQDMAVTVTQMVFDGLETRNTVQENAFLVKAAAYNVKAAAENLSLEIAEAYLDVLNYQNQLRVARNNLTNHQKIYDQISLRSKSGIGKLSELEQAEARLALARTNLLSIQALLNNAEANYIRFVGNCPVGLVRPNFPDSALPGSESAAVILAIENSPLLAAAVAEICAFQARNWASKAAYFPQIDFELSASKHTNVEGTTTDSERLGAFFRVSYGLFRGGADRARDRETAWEFEKAKSRRDEVRREVSENTRIAWNDYVSARSQLGYFRIYAQSTERTRDAFQQQFNIGQRTLLDLLNTENENFQSHRSYIQSQYDELKGRYRILASMGRLTDYLGIKLPQTVCYTPKKWFRYNR